MLESNAVRKQWLDTVSTLSTGISGNLNHPERFNSFNLHVYYKNSNGS